MRGRRGRNKDLNYWPSIADFMLALFMIALILGLTNLTLLYSQQESVSTQGENLLIAERELKACEQKKGSESDKASQCDKDLLTARQNLCQVKLEGVIARVQQCTKQLTFVKENINQCLVKLDACLNPLKQENNPPVANNSLPAEQQISPNNLQDCETKLEQELKKAEQCDKDLTEANTHQTKCESDLDACLNEIHQTELKILNEKNKPLILEITDAQGLTFMPNSAKTADFKLDLKAKFAEWKKMIDDHPGVNTIEIIGHTDADKISEPDSNLDKALQNALSSDELIDQGKFKSGSNADLGLWRAVAMSQEWRKWLETLPKEEQDRIKSRIKVRCYSAAYGVPNKKTQGLSEQERKQGDRRIEIRFTQLLPENS
ncbi:MAG: hypothetical protein ACXWTS_00215 [Methylococcaceae bacterium]